jgi:hypothetical protein
MFQASAFDILRATHRFGDPSMALAFVRRRLDPARPRLTGSKKTKAATSVLTGAGILGYGAHKALMAVFAVTGWGLWLARLAAIVANYAPLFAKRDR